MKEAEKWQRVSGSFERIEIAMNHVKELGMTFFSGIAEHLAPALEDALDALDDMSTRSPISAPWRANLAAP